MRSLIRTALMTAMLLWALPVHAAQSFVYVGILVPPSAAQPCPPGSIQVYDAATTELVTSVPFGDCNRMPRAMALSPDGRRLYIAASAIDGANGSISVFDTTRHRLLATHPIPQPPAFSWAIAVSPDNQRVFVAGFDKLVVWNVQTAAVTSTQAAGYRYLFTDTARNRIVAAAQVTEQVTPLTLASLDPVTGAVVHAKSGWIPGEVSMSADGSRIYHADAFAVHIYDPVTFDEIDDISGCEPCRPIDAVDATGRNRIYVLQQNADTVIGVYPFDRATNQSVSPPVVFSGVRRDAVVAGDESSLWVSISSGLSNTGVNPWGLTVVDLATFTLRRILPLAAVPTALAVTPPDAGRCSYTATPRQSSWAREGGTTTITLATECDWMASTSASWLHLSPGASSGSGSRTFEITVDPFFGGDATRTANVIIGGQVVTFTQAGFGAQPAFGSFDTPTDNTTGITGSLPVTGWALDDIGITRVRIFRDPVAGEAGAQIYIGDATFVEGARPDVAAIFPSAPFATRAGWGYLLLTNMLPNGGDGTYRIHAYADDIDGHTTLLGSKTISCSNSTATLPFGAIDTPGQGETVSGTIVNWGWVLTPQPGSIPADGSTIDVIIDGVAAGHPTYGVLRPDVAALFPGYANTNGAGGYFTIDTTTLANGLHSIAWVVRDNLGRAQGIGSRYFTVINP